MQKKCRCRGPKKHRDCAYCGTGFSDHICGVCKEAGIDGPVIPGTGRVVCKLHKKPDYISKYQLEKAHRIMNTQSVRLS